jgi:hypothetical protein
MECSSVREKLSAYLEDAVPREERVLIEEHLKSCAECRSDLADLHKTINHIKGLGEVEPPAWMTQKIIAKVRDEARPKKGILWRLFYPLHIKLPLEAVAAILVVGIALYIYRDIRLEPRLAKAPFDESAPQILQKEITREDKIGPTRKLQKVQPEVTAPEKSARAPVSGKKEARTDKIEVVPKSPEPSRPTPLTREERGTAASIPSKEQASVLNNETKREAAQATVKLKTLSERKMENSVLTVKVQEPERANEEIEKIVVAFGGKIIERQSHEGRRMFTIVLKVSKFDELLEKLKLLGDVTKKGPALRDYEENIRVRIETVEAQKQAQ